MTNFTQHTFPEATARIEATLGSVGLRRPETVADWARTIELLHRTQETLVVLTPAAFELDLGATVTGLAPAAGGGFGRFWHGLFDGAYRSALKSARAAAVDPKAKGAALLRQHDRGPSAACRLARGIT